MPAKIEKFLEDLFNLFAYKVVLSLVFLIFLFIYFNRYINCLISQYLLVPVKFNYPLLDYVLAILLFVAIIKMYKKIFVDKYFANLNEILVSGAIVFLVEFYREGDFSFEYLKASYGVPYIYFIYIPALFFLLFIFFKWLSFFFQSKTEENSNTYLDDNPIEDPIKDELDYQPIVRKIKEILLNNNYEKSFSIGLVGAWGNGKSSVFKMVNGQITPQKSFIDKAKVYFRDKSIYPIVINFLPYLNHKEEDIISEFFTELSSNLKKYDGVLSEHILNYSEKITNLYKEQNIRDFFKSPSKSSDIPTGVLYVQINEILRKLNKKIIVFIDDLDRLNENEILQVLKLIRNTADFTNIIFLVAMDKDYVVNRLKADDKILDAKYIDKFFQLEIYLPEIPSEKIKEIFINQLLKSPLAANNMFEIELRDALKSKYNLFDEYIKNLRDVKRIINQLIFDYPFFANEIDLKDLMNFIYFKLKFPKAIKSLNDGRNDFLNLNTTVGTGYYELKKKDKDAGSKTITSNIFNVISASKNNVSIGDYIVYDMFKIGDIFPNDYLKIDDSDLVLFIKTLVCLFGDVNQVETTKSIKFENNFRKLMQQKYLETDLLESEFVELFSDAEEKLKQHINDLFSNKKLNQVLTRFEYFNIEDKVNLEKAILILSLIYDSGENFNINSFNVTKLLNEFVKKIVIIDNENNIANWLLEFILPKLSTKNQLLLITELWADVENSKLILDRQSFDDEVVRLFEQYLIDNKETEISPTDYTVYQLYHSAKKINNLKEKLKELFIGYWDTHNIELLCCQITDMGRFTVSTFKISDTAEEFFGSKDDFIRFVNDTNNQTSEIKEFLKLYELMSITNHKYEVLFEFKCSVKMLEKIKTIKELPGRSGFNDMEDVCQVFLETNSQKIVETIVNNHDLKYKYDISYFNHDSLYFLVANIKSITKDVVISFFQDVSNVQSSGESPKEIIRKEAFKFEEFYKRGDDYIKLKSCKPESILK